MTGGIPLKLLRPAPLPTPIFEARMCAASSSLPAERSSLSALLQLAFQAFSSFLSCCTHKL